MSVFLDRIGHGEPSLPRLHGRRSKRRPGACETVAVHWGLRTLNRLSGYNPQPCMPSSIAAPPANSPTQALASPPRSWRVKPSASCVSFAAMSWMSWWRTGADLVGLRLAGPTPRTRSKSGPTPDPALDVLHCLSGVIRRRSWLIEFGAQVRWPEMAGILNALADQLKLFRCYYNFMRPHSSLPGKRTPAMQAAWLDAGSVSGTSSPSSTSAASLRLLGHPVRYRMGESRNRDGWRSSNG